MAGDLFEGVTVREIGAGYDLVADGSIPRGNRKRRATRGVVDQHRRKPVGSEPVGSCFLRSKGSVQEMQEQDPFRTRIGEEIVAFIPDVSVRDVLDIGNKCCTQ
jgi:hypothetical protein